MAETAIVPVPSKPSGKTPKRIRHKKAIEKAELYVARNLPKYLAKLEELAMGVLVMKEGRDGEEIIYSTLPDRQAAMFLAERAMGRQPTREELIEGEASGPMGYIPFIPAAAMPPQLEESNGA